jgi:hypothetical protein
MIGLFPLEPDIIYTSFMQIADFYKGKVSWYSAVHHYLYDKVYCASLFTFTDKSMVRPDMICGGTGFNLETKLPPEIEECNYDYNLYPKCRNSYLWFSRGCDRGCWFCVVKKKEGKMHSVEPKNPNPHTKEVHIMDNNPFANPEKDRMIDYVLKTKLPVVFESGIDCRLPIEDYGPDLAKMKIKRLHTAWDNNGDDLENNLKSLTKYVPAWKIGVYVFVCDSGEDFVRDWHRVKTIEKLGMDPWVMPFNKKDPYQRRFENLVNRAPRFKRALEEKTEIPSYMVSVMVK